MRMRIAVVAFVSAAAVGSALVSAQQTQHAGAACNVTRQNDAAGVYGNALLTVGLWPAGTIVFRPGGPGFMTRDGALGMKFLWTRGVRGKLSVTGRRLDEAAAPLRLEANSAYGDIGIQPSYLIFPTPGCWEVTAQVAGREDSSISFITNVVKIGEGPSWRRDPSGK